MTPEERQARIAAAEAEADRHAGLRDTISRVTVQCPIHTQAELADIGDGMLCCTICRLVICGRCYDDGCTLDVDHPGDHEAGQFTWRRT